MNVGPCLEPLLTKAVRGALFVLACASAGGCGEDVLRLGEREDPTGPPVVEQLLLRESPAGRLVAALSDQTTFSIAALPSTGVGVEAVVTGLVDSVEFMLDDDVIVEDDFPFIYPGDTIGKPKGFAPVLGEHRVTATPYSEPSARGQRGPSVTVAFSFVE
jgi:hypothetical protein